MLVVITNCYDWANPASARWGIGVMRWWADESECGLFVLSKSPTSPSSGSSHPLTSLQSTPLYLFGLVSTQINNFNPIIFQTQFSLLQAGDPTDVMYGWCHKCREKFNDQYKALTG